MSRHTQGDEYHDGKLGVDIDPASMGASVLGGQAGSSSNDWAGGGVLYKFVGASGQVGTGPDTLASYSVPANTLNVANQTLRWRAAGVMATTATGCQIDIKFGGTTLISLTGNPVSGGQWWAEGEIHRLTSTTQRAVSHGGVNQGSTDIRFFGDVTPAETLTSGTPAFVISGNSGTNANNDTVLHCLTIFWEDANS